METQIVIVYGDSITAGALLPTADSAQAWVPLVEAQSGGRLQMIAEGKGGRPTNSLQEFEEMLHRRPHTDILVIALSANDARDISKQCVPTAVRNLRAIIARARDAYGATLPIVLVGPTNIRKDALGPTRPIADQRDVKLRDLNVAIAELAKEVECQFVSTYGVVPATSLSHDGVHPDSAGHAAIARTLLPVLLQLTKECRL